MFVFAGSQGYTDAVCCPVPGYYLWSGAAKLTSLAAAQDISYFWPAYSSLILTLFAFIPRLTLSPPAPCVADPLDQRADPGGTRCTALYTHVHRPWRYLCTALYTDPGGTRCTHTSPGAHLPETITLYVPRARVRCPWPGVRHSCCCATDRGGGGHQ